MAAPTLARATPSVMLRVTAPPKGMAAHTSVREPFGRLAAAHILGSGQGFLFEGAGWPKARLREFEGAVSEAD